MEVISIANRKGGIGKTTLSVNLSYELSRKEKKVLMVDLDSQCDLTKIYSSGKKDTVFDLLQEKEEIEEVVAKVKKNLHLLPGSKDIVHLDKELKAEKLKQKIEKIGKKLELDYVVIDHPPQINEAALQGLVASDEVLVVVEPEAFCLSNLGDLLDELGEIKKEMNPELHILGMAINRVDRRRNLTERMIDKIRNTFRGEVFATEISNDTAVPTSMREGLPVRELGWRSKTVSQFQRLIEEMEGRLNNGNERSEVE